MVDRSVMLSLPNGRVENLNKRSLKRVNRLRYKNILNVLQIRYKYISDKSKSLVNGTSDI